MLFFANVLSLIPEDTIDILYVVCLVLLQIFIGGVQQQKIEYVKYFYGGCICI